jgi:hypothetical protein
MPLIIKMDAYIRRNVTEERYVMVTMVTDLKDTLRDADMRRNVKKFVFHVITMMRQKMKKKVSFYGFTNS